MKNLIVPALLLLLSGCSSMTYIETQPYADQLSQRCLQQQQQVDEDVQEHCEEEAEHDAHIAERIYELRAATDLENCRAEHQDEQAIDQCFQQAQQAFYDQYFATGKH